MTLLTYIINGISLGSVYAIIALGYTMVYGIAKMLNFAHGDIIMVGAYISYFAATSFGMPPAVCILVSMAACTVLGIAIERFAYRPLRSANSLAVLITAIGVSGELTITGSALVTVISCLAVMALLLFITQKTKIGKAMRAVSEDKEAAQLMGINVNFTISVTFAIGSALAAVAGVLLCSSYPSLYPTLGSMTGIKAFTAAVFGGIGSIPGAFVGGILLGVIEKFAEGYISTQLSNAIVFSVLIIVLLVRPAGLFGKVRREKV